MKLEDFGMDRYDRHARLRPALIILLPLTLAAIVVTPNAYKAWTIVIGAIAQAGGSYLLSQLVGDVGKRKEPQLFAMWGGRPTELMLSHKHAPNSVQLASRHKRLVLLLKGVKIPTAAMEKADTKAAFDVYAAAADKLRGIVRAEGEKYAHVQRENIHYGFRRNMWANRKTALWIAVPAIVPVIAELGGHIAAHEVVDVDLPLIAIVQVLLICYWLFVVTPNWVRRAANLYTERLLETLDSLSL